MAGKGKLTGTIIANIGFGLAYSITGGTDQAGVREGAQEYPVRLGAMRKSNSGVE